MINKKAQAAQGPWTTFHTLVSVIIFIIGLVLVLAMIITIDVKLHIMADEVIHEQLARRMLYSASCLAYVEDIGVDGVSLYHVYPGIIDSSKLTEDRIENCLSAKTIGSGSGLDPEDTHSLDFSYQYIITMEYLDGSIPPAPISGGHIEVEAQQERAKVYRNYLVKYYDGTNFKDALVNMDIEFAYRKSHYGWFDFG